MPKKEVGRLFGVFEFICLLSVGQSSTDGKIRVHKGHGGDGNQLHAGVTYQWS